MGNLDNADQRIVEDLNEFCDVASDMFSRSFKPLLDLVLGTMRMSESLGYKGLACLYTYFILAGGVVRSFSPPFPKLIAAQQMLDGNFRHSHSRLIAHSEEVRGGGGGGQLRACGGWGGGGDTFIQPPTMHCFIQLFK
jgi:ABC-type uncharacterized transport system fused permease/ATPase subunit